MMKRKWFLFLLCLTAVLSGCTTETEEQKANVWENGMEISGVMTSEKSSLIEEKPASGQHESEDSGASAVAKSIQNSVNDSMAQIMEAGFLQGYTYTYEPDKKAVDVITKSCSKTSDPTKCYVESVMSAKDELDNSGESADYSYTYKASSAVVKTVKEGCEGAEDPTQCYIDLAMAKKQTMSVPDSAVSTASTDTVKKTNVTAKVLKEGCEAAENPNQCYINQAMAASVPSSSSQLASVSSGSMKSGSSSLNTNSYSSSKSSSAVSSGKTGCEASDDPTQCYIKQAQEKAASRQNASAGLSNDGCGENMYRVTLNDGTTYCVHRGVYEVDDSSVEQSACEKSGGSWAGKKCNCTNAWPLAGDDGLIRCVPYGVLPADDISVEQRACEKSGGSWAAKKCNCTNAWPLAGDDGLIRCVPYGVYEDETVEAKQTCVEHYGTWNGSSCVCPKGGSLTTFNNGYQGCVWMGYIDDDIEVPSVEDRTAQNTCEEHYGTWNGSSCVCPKGGSLTTFNNGYQGCVWMGYREENPMPVKETEVGIIEENPMPVKETQVPVQDIPDPVSDSDGGVIEDIPMPVKETEAGVIEDIPMPVKE